MRAKAQMGRYTEIVTVWTGRLETGDYGRFSIADGRPVLERWTALDLNRGANGPTHYTVEPWEEVDENESWGVEVDGA